MLKHSKQLKYLVTGTGRCGTVFMARLLTSLGEMCGHESVFWHEGEAAARRVLASRKFFTSGCSKGDWFVPAKMTSESSYMAAPFLDRPLLDGTKIIHVVRNPLKVISSHTKDVHFFEYPYGPQIDYQRFVLQYLPEIAAIENLVERACYYYVHWNTMIEKKSANRPYLLHNVEKKLSSELIHFMEISNPPESYHNNEKTNSWNHRDKDLTLNDIPNGTIKNKFINLAGKYGYDL